MEALPLWYLNILQNQVATEGPDEDKAALFDTLFYHLYDNKGYNIVYIELAQPDGRRIFVSMTLCSIMAGDLYKEASAPSESDEPSQRDAGVYAAATEGEVNVET